MINWAHVHLMINHFPVIGILGVIILLVYALIVKSEEVKRAGIGALVLLALITIPVYFTGKASVETVKNLPGVTETYTGRHEEVASLALVLVEALGLTAAIGLFFLRHSAVMPNRLIAVILALALAVAGILGLTANLGGQIRHTEIRDDAVKDAQKYNDGRTTR
jgi:uncharacterized membrane protein